MRIPCLLAIAFLAACGEPGLRDRSLREGETPHGARTPHYSARRVSAPVSVVGLIPDPIAHLYAEHAGVVVRFEDLATMERSVEALVAEIGLALPVKGLPQGSGRDMLRRAAGLGEKVEIDGAKPFAFLRLADRWLAILPARGEDPRLRPLEEGYAVAGDPLATAGYRPGRKKGFCLAGQFSIYVAPEAAAGLGAMLRDLLRPLGLDAGVLQAIAVAAPVDIERIDVAGRLSPTGCRVDLRLTPTRGSLMARTLDRLRPVSSLAARFLPSEGAAYLETTASPLSWEPLLLNLPEGVTPIGDWSDAGGYGPLRRAFSALGGESAAVLAVPPGTPGTVHLITHLSDPGEAALFLKGPELTRLLDFVAGRDGHLEWAPNSFQRHGASVGTVTGYLGAETLARLRDRGPAGPALAQMLRGPVVAYVATVDGRLLLVVGQKGRAEMEKFIDRVAQGASAENDHTMASSALFEQRLGAVSLDLAALYDGVRETAPLWWAKGRPLRDVELRWRTPLEAAVTVEGGSLRFALRLTPRPTAAAVAKVLAAIEKSGG